MWSWWRALDLGRGSGGFGPSRITHTDIVNWSALSGAMPSPLEVQMLFIIDAAYLAEANRIREQSTPKPGKRS